VTETAVEGRRVLIRPLVEADTLALFEAVQASREQLRRRLAWVDAVKGPEDVAAFIRACQQSEGRSHVFGVLDRQSNALIGVASLERLETAHASKAQVSGWIRSDQQDRGLGTEALRLVCDHAFSRLGLHRLYARIDPANRPSRKVFKKLRFHYEGSLLEDKKLNGRWVNQECWGLLRSEWQRGAR
jgi:RimJ/RimL family protein N-acetyltransferase